MQAISRPPFVLSKEAKREILRMAGAHRLKPDVVLVVAEDCPLLREFFFLKGKGAGRAIKRTFRVFGIKMLVKKLGGGGLSFLKSQELQFTRHPDGHGDDKYGFYFQINAAERKKYVHRLEKFHDAGGAASL